MLKPYQRAELEFDLLDEIGQDGKNSRTYKIFDHQLGAEFVAKHLEKASIQNDAEFFDESKRLYLSAHPNVVQICYACVDEENVILVMPYYQRGSLKDIMGAGYLTVRDIVTIGIQMLAGLHNVHSKGLVHFDIKPDNIMISDRGEALLSDFGQARAMNFGGEAQQDRLYLKILPPEALGDQDAFSRSFDIYQVGLTLYRMCNGDERFYDQFNKYMENGQLKRDEFCDDVVNGRFPDRRTGTFLPHIPVSLRRLIQDCLHVNPAERPRSALAVANALGECEGNILDWSYSQEAVDRVWTKNKNGTYWELRVDGNRNSVCFKKAGTAGQKRRFNRGCVQNITDTQIRTFLQAN